MIEVLAGTDLESDVADAGTVEVSRVVDVAGTTKFLRVIIYPHLTYDNNPHLLRCTRMQQ